jgi:hypothetical protein
MFLSPGPVESKEATVKMPESGTSQTGALTEVHRKSGAAGRSRLGQGDVFPRLSWTCPEVCHYYVPPAPMRWVRSPFLRHEAWPTGNLAAVLFFWSENIWGHLHDFERATVGGSISGDVRGLRAVGTCLRNR